MERWARPLARGGLGATVRVGFVVLAASLGLLAACGDDGGGSPEVSTGAPTEDYAEQAEQVCETALDEARDLEGDERAARYDDGAAELAALVPPEDQRAAAQSLVDGFVAYADLYRNESGEDLSQAVNELHVVVAVRAAGLELTCGQGGDTLFAPEAPAEAIDDPEADPELEPVAQDCFEGDLVACDDLVGEDGYTFYGVTCGGRLFHEEADDNLTCVESFGAERPFGDQP